MSLAVRVIPCLDVDAGRVVKGINFKELRDAGDPVELARTYDAEGADELTFLDISASHEGRATTLEMVSATAEQVFIPLTVGGGIRSVDDVDTMLRAGADKIAVNTAAIHRPELVAEIADRFGNQVLVLSVDARRAPRGTDSGLRGHHPRRPQVRRAGCDRLGGPGRRARRGGDPAQRDGRRRHHRRLRPRADPGRAHARSRSRSSPPAARAPSSTSRPRSRRARTPYSRRPSSTSARCGSPTSSRRWRRGLPGALRPSTREQQPLRHRCYRIERSLKQMSDIR